MSIRQLVVPCAALCFGIAAVPPAPESIAPNDNRHPAGTLKNGVLTVTLEARRGLWRPEGEKGYAIDVAAWGEAGKPLTAPGPLMRMPAGTEVHATLKNTLDRPLAVFGLSDARAKTDSVVVPAHGSRDVKFKATTAGTFFYFARNGMEPFGIRKTDDTQLGGAFVVDPPGAPANRDRVMVLSWWFTLDSLSPTGLGRGTMAINGLSWPHTERIDLTQGDSVHWRVVNLTDADHPMHLHGFYFRVESKGDGTKDSVYTADQRRLAVTEVMNPFQTATLSFLPDRSGNWIYHCHYADHLSANASLDTEKGKHNETMTMQHGSDAPHQMYGLVLGLRVAPKGAAAQPTDAPRAIRLLVREKPNVYGKKRGFAFVLGGTPAEKDASAMPVPGPTLVLERGKRVAITVVNTTKDRAAVHWHGIELESYPDGVPGWSGTARETLPSIAPGDSLTVRFTPPRSGTFMYHSHFNEAEQISSGLYGPIIVVDPGQKFDPDRDRVLFVGNAGTATNVVFGPFPHYLLNGSEQPKMGDLKVGTSYRFRVIDLADFGPIVVALNSGKTPVSWRAVAKDGAMLPQSQATARPAMLMSDPGEINDFEYTPAKPGDLALSFGPPPPPPGSPPPPPNLPPPPPTRSVAIHVRQ